MFGAALATGYLLAQLGLFGIVYGSNKIEEKIMLFGSLKTTLKQATVL